MSGGKFDYKQYHIGEIADEIQSELDKMGKEVPKEDRWHSDEWYKKYPKDLIYPTYSGKTIEEFQNAIKYLRIAHIYAQRIDWFLSADDGEETFHERLTKELKELEKKNKRLVKKRNKKDI